MRRARWLDLRILILAVACALGLVAFAALLFLPTPPKSLPPLSDGPPTRSIVIEGVDLELSYQASTANDTGYFESPECEECPVNETPNGQWFFQFTLQNNGTTAHRFTGISVSAPFTLDAILPEPPVIFSPGEAEEIGVTLQLPSAPGYYFVEGTIGAA